MTVPAVRIDSPGVYAISDEPTVTEWQPIETAPANTERPLIVDYGRNTGTAFGWLRQYDSGDREWTIWFPVTSFMSGCTPPKRWMPMSDSLND